MAELYSSWSSNNPYAGTVDYDALADYYSGYTPKSKLDKKGYARQDAAARAYQMYEQALQWESEQFRITDERDYNDPASIARRERAAGINPDLAGLGSGTPAAGTSMTSQSPAGLEDNPDTLGAALGIVSTMRDTLGSSLSLVGQIQGIGIASKQSDILSEQLHGIRLDNASKRLSNYTAENAAFFDYVLNNYDEETLKAFSDDARPDAGLSFASALSADDFSSYTGLDIDSSKRILSNYSKRFASPAFKKRFIEMLNQYSSDRKSYLDLVASPGYSDGYSPSAFLRAQKTILEVGDMIQSKYQSELLSYLNPQLAAQATNASNQLSYDVSSSTDGTLVGRASNAKNYLQSVTDENIDPELAAQSVNDEHNAASLQSRIIADIKTRARELMSSSDPLEVQTGLNLYSFAQSGSFMAPKDFLGQIAGNFVNGVNRIAQQTQSIFGNDQPAEYQIP